MAPQQGQQKVAPSVAHVQQNEPVDFDALPAGVREVLYETALQKSYTAARFAPKDKADLRDLAEEWYDSDLLPEAYYPPAKDENNRPIKYTNDDLRWYRKRGISRAVIVMRYGAALGVLPELAIRLIYIIDGQPSPAAALMLAIFLASPVCAVFEPLESTATKARMRVGRKGQKPFEVEAAYAEYQHLHGRKNWKQYPLDLVYARCLSRAMRRVAPDLFAGVYCAEERVDMRADRAAGKVEESVERILAAVDHEERRPERQVEPEPPPAQPQGETPEEPEALPADTTGLAKRIADLKAGDGDAYRAIQAELKQMPDSAEKRPLVRDVLAKKAVVFGESGEGGGA